MGMNNQSLRFLFLMDPYASLNLETETSLLCMNELMARGHRVYWLEETGLYLTNGIVKGQVNEVITTAPFRLARNEEAELSEFDALVIRKDPPFDKNYLHITYLLDFLPSHVHQFNSPRALRDVNEKLFTLNWAHYCPDSVTTMNPAILRTFAKKHGKIVVKPLDDCSGRGIEFLRPEQDDFDERVADLFGSTQRYLMAQQYLPEVSEGDKRIYMIDGEAAGWVNRIPPPGSDLANIHQGASCHPFELDQREKQIVAAIGPELKRRGLLLVGLDIIGGYMTEINVTSPSAVRQINQVNGSHLEKQIVDAMLAQIDCLEHPEEPTQTASQHLSVRRMVGS
tara:strand:+ start:249 stop:1265 length:1017 start_codon:yes stop_codon:yes gene_type:complete